MKKIFNLDFNRVTGLEGTIDNHNETLVNLGPDEKIQTLIMGEFFTIRKPSSAWVINNGNGELVALYEGDEPTKWANYQLSIWYQINAARDNQTKVYKALVDLLVRNIMETSVYFSGIEKNVIFTKNNYNLASHINIKVQDAGGKHMPQVQVGEVYVGPQPISYTANKVFIALKDAIKDLDI